jgi:predicted unusual protein kinase regulating ubiquinone biosynthesis (AarF/ABC1/UbiB family)
VALLDYGQVKEMPEDLRLAYANLVVAMADDDLLRAEEGFRYAQLQAMLYSTVYIYLNS